MPPSANSKRPSLRPTAPVNEPRSCPNSSDSSSVSDNAAHDTFTKGLPLRGEFSCKACAISSLPVPDSPRMSTVALVTAACRTTSSTDCSSGASPIRPSSRYRSCTRARRFAVSRISARFSIAFSSTASTVRTSSGLTR